MLGDINETTVLYIHVDALNNITSCTCIIIQPITMYKQARYNITHNIWRQFPSLTQTVR